MQNAVDPNRKLYDPWAMPHPVPHTFCISTFEPHTEFGSRTLEALAEIEGDYAKYLLSKLDESKVPGDVIEFGVAGGFWLVKFADWREQTQSKRIIWGFDSFEGLPRTTEHDLDCWSEGMYAHDFEEVSRRLRVAERPWLKLKKGWFSETIQHIDVQTIEKVSLVRIDCDLYEPAVECLDYLKPRLSVGSIIVFDDWTYNPEKGETKALLEWLARNPTINLELILGYSHGHFYFRVVTL
jgi:hypothetical protein